MAKALEVLRYLRDKFGLSDYDRLEDVREYYDPHPGRLGALARLPEPVRAVAAQLDGKSLPLREAQDRIRAALGDTQGTISVLQESIQLEVGANMWRVIKHRFPS